MASRTIHCGIDQTVARCLCDPLTPKDGGSISPGCLKLFGVP